MSTLILKGNSRIFIKRYTKKLSPKTNHSHCMKRSWKKLLLKALNPLDNAARVLNNKSQMPPLDLRWDVGPLKNFESSGAEFRVYVKLLGGLKPDHRFLDIGCGCGQMALELADQFDDAGCYVGCDINASAIAWCTKHLAHSDKRFSFFHMDVRNGMYNPAGKVNAAQYRFPNLGSFDLILLKSVFTHMMTDEVENYIAQLPALLSKEGKCVATFFLLNERQRLFRERGKNQILFHPQDDSVAFAQPDIPEAIVAFDELSVVQMLQKHGLKVNASHYGTWSGDKSCTSHQDILILQRVR
jgi:SAM-dependent methyltransferase